MGRRGLRGTVTRAVAGGEATLVPDPDLPEGWLLLVEGTQQSHVDLADPSHLVFEYMRRIGHVIDLLPPGPLRVVHLGGGAMALARYASATRPRTRNLVVEHDAALVDLVRAHLPWPRDHQIRVRIAEARAALESLPDESADLLVLDVFASARTPGNLTTVEAFSQVRRVLTPAGTLVANIADENPLTYARRYVSGVRTTFDRVVVAAEPAVLRGRRFGNLIVVAQSPWAEPLDLAALTRRSAGDPWPARVLHAADLDVFVGDHLPFTDATATGSPVPPPGVFG
jgi:spermidine synthase